MTSIGDYNKIMSDRNIFNQIVYTPLSEALRLLEERRKNPELVSKIEKLLNYNILPPIENNNKCAVLLRQIATPNNEIRLFIKLAKENNLHPVICEYIDDKFNSNNDYKHSLGQILIQNKQNKNGHDCVEKITIFDFNKYNGQKLRNVITFWQQPLIDFHKLLFKTYYKDESITVWDGSVWYKEKGINNNVLEHYRNLFLFFVCHGILFENFLTSKDKEGDFTKNIVLPTIEKIINLTGVKPLIVPIEPIDLEAEEFWYHHLLEVKKLIPKK